MSSALVFETQTLDLTAIEQPEEDWLVVLRHELDCRLAPLDLVSLARQTFVDRAPDLERSGLAPILQTPNRRITILGDADRLVQVIDNLLSNARRYTAPGGLVGIEVVPVGSQVRLTVSDTGQGIAPGRLPEIFNQGLGLAIASRIVASHSGRIEAQSPGVGRGASFVVYLPMMPFRPLRVNG
jgi:signal transduction histidine kinase